MELKLKCHPKQYRHLVKLFGTKLNLPHNHYVAKHILHILKISKTSFVSDEIEDEVYSFTYPINVPLWVYSQCGISSFSPGVTRLINKYLLENFQSMFYLRVHELVYISSPKLKILDALYVLLNEWNFDDEITLEAFKKDYYRYRKKHPEIFKKNTFGFVPNVRTCKDESIVNERIEFRIPSELKEHFYKKCQKLNLECSSVLREFILQFNQVL